LVQAGSESDGDGTNYVWLEVSPGVILTQLPDFGLNVAGHTLGVHINFTHTGAITIHIVDETNGIDRRYVTGIPNTAPDGHTEFIVERPEVNGSLPPLANFGTATFSGAQSASLQTGWVPVGKLPHYYYDMYNVQGTRRLAITFSISSDGYSFPVGWRYAN
jgi:hypothetical protein